MRGNPVEEEAIMGNNHGAAGKFFQRDFKRGQGFAVQIIGRLIEQQQVGRLGQHFGQMDAITLPA